MRKLVWFSCGAASAVAAKISVKKYGDECEVLYCDTLAYEHPDNLRFLKDCEKWYGKEIKILKSDKYRDIYDVFEKTRWLVGVGGARCTTELKKVVRKKYQRPTDTHIFGFTMEEKKRIDRFNEENPELLAEFPLYDGRVSKSDCYRIIREAGIEIPAMYKLGYKNNNCIGCVKGQSGYWNKVRIDFPEIFQKMALTERKLNAAINKTYKGGKRTRVFLDELPPDAGKYAGEPDIECGVLCVSDQFQAEINSSGEKGEGDERS